MIRVVILHHILHHRNYNGASNKIKCFSFNMLQGFLNSICVMTLLLEGRVSQDMLVQVQSRAPFYNSFKTFKKLVSNVCYSVFSDFFVQINNQTNTFRNTSKHLKCTFHLHHFCTIDQIISTTQEYQTSSESMPSCIATHLKIKERISFFLYYIKEGYLWGSQSPPLSIQINLLKGRLT